MGTAAIGSSFPGATRLLRAARFRSVVLRIYITERRGLLAVVGRDVRGALKSAARSSSEIGRERPASQLSELVPTDADLAIGTPAPSSIRPRCEPHGCEAVGLRAFGRTLPASRGCPRKLRASHSRIFWLARPGLDEFLPRLDRAT